MMMRCVLPSHAAPSDGLQLITLGMTTKSSLVLGLSRCGAVPALDQWKVDDLTPALRGSARDRT